MLDKRLLGHRDRERVEWELLDWNMAHVDWLRCVKGSGQITESIYTDIRAMGTVTTHDIDVDWNRHLVRPWYAFGDSEDSRWPLGTFIVTTSEIKTTATGRVCELAMYDRTHILRQDKIDESFSLDVGTNVVEAAVNIVQDAGIAQIAATESGEKLLGASVWDFLDSKMQIANDLLTSINYFGLWADELGVIQMQPYTLPAARPVVHEFIDGENCVYLPEFSSVSDGFEVPNVVALLGRLEEMDSDDPPLRAIAVNNDPASRFSIPSRGYRIVDGDPSTETTSQAALDGLAARKLAEASTVATKHTITTPWLPIPLHSGATFENRRTGRARVGVTVTERRTRLATPVTQELTLREVAP